MIGKKIFTPTKFRINVQTKPKEKNNNEQKFKMETNELCC